jgi:hypothetical protein
MSMKQLVSGRLDSEPEMQMPDPIDRVLLRITDSAIEVG